MFPRVCQRDSRENYTRYTFLYQEMEGYDHWRWTEFDVNLLKTVSSGLNLSIIHLDQPRQPNGMSFRDNLSTIFREDNIKVKIICGDDDIGIFGKAARKVVPPYKRNQIFIVDLGEINTETFDKLNGIGCFWSVCMYNGDYDVDVKIDMNVINDDMFHINEKLVDCVFYRDYMQGRLSILSKSASVSNEIEKQSREAGLMIVDRNIRNIFDTSYIGNMYGSDIREK